MATTKTARAEAAEKTRERLIDAATELFAREGLGGPSLDAICKHAGFTRGAFYVHFQSRDDLIVAVVEKIMGGFIDAILVAGEAGADLATIVRTFAIAVKTGAFPFRGEVRPHQVLEACARSPQLHATYLSLIEEARRRLVIIVRDGQETGAVRTDLDADAVAQLLLALVLGTEIATELGVPHDASAVAENVLRMISPSPA
ncbi:MAG: TetR/AcrR family transcriptional regulator [Myxococcota bacterium]|nr:TetR/AcrR family transcriptional regulator [Myxococcota bacterium]